MTGIEKFDRYLRVIFEINKAKILQIIIGIRQITFTLHTDSSDKQSGDVISLNDKPVYLFLGRLIKE